MQDLRYPIGEFSFPERTTAQERRGWIREIEALPAHLRAAVRGLSKPQLDTPYRPGGWTVRQLTHHLPDSHLNAFVRFKLALTEAEPTIKPYDEARWATLPDYTVTPVEVSLELLESLHTRWVGLLRSLGEAELALAFRHPELGRAIRLDQSLGHYAWHSRHHVAHITKLRERMGWQ